MLRSSHSVVALLTDFGLIDGYVGVMKGVIAGIGGDRTAAQIIDITHDIPPQHISAAAWIIKTSYRYFPGGTIFVCVVDPGVGSERKAIAIHAGEWFFVGPDNGLFSYIYEEQNVHEAVVLSNTVYHLPHVSSTFQGRDIFAPAGAHLASGVTLAELGTSIEPTSLQRIDVGHPVVRGTMIEGRILHIDHFGNLITSIPLALVPDFFTRPHVEMRFLTDATVVSRRNRFFGEADHDNGTPFLYGDSSGNIGIAIRNGNAARELCIEYGTTVMLNAADISDRKKYGSPKK